jgi:hypothetical protein
VAKLGAAPVIRTPAHAAGERFKACPMQAQMIHSVWMSVIRLARSLIPGVILAGYRVLSAGRALCVSKNPGSNVL